MTRRLELDDISNLQLPSEPAISPDGRQVVYVLRTTDIEKDVDHYVLFSVRATPTGWDVPTRLTAGVADTSPVFSPTGDDIAFLRRGEGPAQLYRLPVHGGEAQRLTELPSGAGAPVWSPDGKYIAFTAPVDRGPGHADDATAKNAPIRVTRLGYKSDGAGLQRNTRTQVHVVNAATGDVRQLTDGDWNAGPAAWSPDSTHLAFAADSDADSDITGESATHITDLGGGPGHRVVDGLKVAGPMLWTADGTALLTVGQRNVAPGHAGLFRRPLDGAAGDIRDLAEPLDRNVMPGGPGYPGGLPQLTADHRSVVFCVRDSGCSHVYAAAADGSDAPRPVIVGDDVVVSGLSLATGADVAAVVLSDPTSYGEVAVVDLNTGALTRLTRHTAAGLPDVELLRPEPRTFTVHDGTQVQGWLLRDPSAPTPAPLLVDAHGGPHNAWHPAADGAHPYHQVLAANGWSVLLLNVRGSDGYGTDFHNAAVGAWGTADERDVLDPVGQLVTEGIADPARLGITGYSYGGYLTCWLTGRTDRFAAAVAGGVVADLTSMWGTSDVGSSLGGQEWPDPFTDPQQLTALSPWSLVGAVTTPTLLLQGLADDRCPPGQAEQWFAALRRRGVPTEMILYPGSSHLFILNGRPSHRADYSRRLINWMEHHMNAPSSTRTSIDQQHWQGRLDELAAKHKVPGATLAIRRAGEPSDELVEAATGVLSTATQVAVTTDSVFQIGSISKVWTTTLVMQLVDQGSLDLDAPIVEVLPDLQLLDPDVAKHVTMRHLLTHTCGVDGDVFTDTGRGDDCIEKYVAALAETPLNHPLGATFSYCNSGFVLAGRVVEVLTGKTWDAALREQIITPLGLTTTSTLPEEAILHRAAIGHISDEPGQDEHPVTSWVMPRAIGPAGLINATAADTTEFAALHLRGGVTRDGRRLLSVASTDAMQAWQTDLPDKHTLGDSWGLGWIRFDWNGERLYGHDGATFGQHAYLRVLPAQGLSVALLTNGGQGGDLFADLYREIFAEVAGVTMAAPFQPPAEAPQVELTRYVGTYVRSSITSEVFERDGGLVLRIIPTGEIAEQSGSTVEEIDLHPVEQGLFAGRLPEQERWMAITFYQLPNGAEYVHYGVRANPKVS